MKKKGMNAFLLSRRAKKLLLTMKLTFLMVVIGLLPVSATVYSQATKFSFKAENKRVIEVLKEIEETSNFRFFYQNEQVNVERRVTLKASNATVEEILDDVFKGQGIGYKVIEDFLILLTPEKQMLEKFGNRAAETQQQQKVVTGKVTDTLKQPLPGVSVVVKGTKLGTVTNFDGEFSFSIPSDAKTLVFSFVGMKPKEVEIAGQRSFVVSLEEENVGLEEVVVVGYGTQKKESVVGAISQIDNQALVRSGVTNVTNAITGKMSGVLTVQQSGEPGANDSEIYIRGLSSWNGSAPLVLVDGIERDFTDLDPNEINTLSVLKDASATAVFGAKGANGVIIVNTKRGALGKPKLDITGSYGVQKATRIPEHIDSYTTMSMYNDALMNGQQFTGLIPQWQLDEYKNPSSPLMALRFPNVNWFDLLSNNYAQVANVNLNLSGGTNFVKYFCSLGYSNEGSFFKAAKDGFYNLNYYYKRINYRANIDFNLTKSTILSFNVGGDTGIRNQPKSVPWYDLYFTSPARFPAYWPEWVLQEVPDPVYPNDSGIRLSRAFGEYTGNPYNTVNRGEFKELTESKLFTDLVLDQKLNFITEGLSFKGKVSLNTYFNACSLKANWSFPEYQMIWDNLENNGQIDPATGRVINPWDINQSGFEVYKQLPLDITVGDLEGGYYQNLYYELALNYARTFGNHNITGLALLNREQKNRETQFAYFNEAVVGRVTYDYGHKYLVELNMGYTGSERFAPGNRFGFFPSAAFGWVLTEEKFFKEAMPWINKFKIRYSDGLVGSDYARSRWLYISSYYKDNRGYIHEDLAPNLSAQWEEAPKKDLGFELVFFKEKLSLSIDLFDEKRYNMLLEPKSVTMMVGNSFKELNLGKVKKHGIEVEIGWNQQLNPEFSFFVKGIAGYSENRVLFKDDPPYALMHQRLEGKPLSEMPSIDGLEYNGVELTGSGYYTTIDDIHTNPASLEFEKLIVGDYKFLDYMVDGTIDKLDKYPIKGSIYPPFTYSFSGGFTWKKFDFNFLFYGNIGKYVQYDQTFEIEFLRGDWRVHSSQLDYWMPTNPNAGHSALHYSGSSSGDRGYWAMIENRFFRNADYLRLKELYAGYTFNPGFLKRTIGVSSLLLYASGNNLVTFTKLIEGDPERKDFQSGFYPQMASMRLGIKLAF